MGDIKSFHLGSKIPAAFQGIKILHPLLGTIEIRDLSSSEQCPSTDTAQNEGPDERHRQDPGALQPPEICWSCGSPADVNSTWAKSINLQNSLSQQQIRTKTQQGFLALCTCTRKWFYVACSVVH